MIGLVTFQQVGGGLVRLGAVRPRANEVRGEEGAEGDKEANQRHQSDREIGIGHRGHVGHFETPEERIRSLALSTCGPSISVPDSPDFRPAVNGPRRPCQERGR